MTSSRSETRSIFMSFRFAASASMSVLLRLDFFDQRVELVEPRLPDSLVALEPIGHRAQRVGAQPIQALLRVSLHVDDAGVLEHAQVLGHLRLVELQALADIVHGTRAEA